MKKNSLKEIGKVTLFFGLSGVILLPLVALAEVTMLAPVPNLDGSVESLPEYLNAVFRVVIIVGAMLAVLRIIWSGFEYMTSEAVGQKKDARGVITAAIGGLILLISTTLVLTVINPSIVNLDALNFGSLGLSSPNTVPSTTSNTTQETDGTYPLKLSASDADELERRNFTTQAEAEAATNACMETVCRVKSVGGVWKVDVDESTVLKTERVTTTDRDTYLVFRNDCLRANGFARSVTSTVTLSDGTKGAPTYEVTCTK